MLTNLRREGFIDALRYYETDLVVSLFGVIPWEIFYAFDVLAINSYGIDYHIVEEERPMCSMLNSTVSYYLTDRCPFMHVSKYYFVDNFCPLRTQVIQQYFDPVYTYDGRPEGLITQLEELTGQQYNEAKLNVITEKSAEISRLILKIQSSSLPGKIINDYAYQTKFIFDLDQRIDFLKEVEVEHSPQKQSVNLQQIAGISHHYDDAVILEGNFCEGERHINTDLRGLEFIKAKYQRLNIEPDAIINQCQMYRGNYINYEGEC